MLCDVSPRAPALPRVERRAAIARAALGILRTRGPAATTREIAEAAGVAEGTLFRAYDSKEELVSAALRQAFDPAPLLAGLAKVAPDQPLRDRLVAAVTLIQGRYLEVFELMHAMGMVHPQDHDYGPGADQEGLPGDWLGDILDRLEAVAAADADLLRVPPREAVRLLWLLTFAGSHHVLTRGDLLAPDTIVDAVLDGVRKAG